MNSDTQKKLERGSATEDVFHLRYSGPC